MSIILYCLGALSVVAGLVMAGFGVPVSEFSFGNTLIVAGAILTVGGLIVFGLGAIVSRLQQILDAGAIQPVVQQPRELEGFESTLPGRTAGGRIPFPPKPKLEPRELPEAASETVETSAQMEPLPASAPTLPNPDEPPVTVAETVSLSPQQPTPEMTELAESKTEPAPEQSRGTDFDQEWPEPAPAPAPERRTFGFKWPERKPEPVAEERPPEPTVAAPAPETPVEEAAPPAKEFAEVAVLKSGVVDGMGYTLYVDGSIEAELPQGTLRFASINELRQHLEQNS